MVEDRMAQDDTEGAPGTRGRGRRRPPTIEGTASDLSPEQGPASTEDVSAPAAPASGETQASAPADHVGEPVPGVAEADESGARAEAEPLPQEPVPTAPEPRAEPARAKTSFLPLLAAALVGGVVSAGGVTLFGAAGRSEAPVKNIEPRIVAAEQSAATANAALQSLKADFGRLSGDLKQASPTPGAPNSTVDLAPLETRLAALEMAMADVGRKVEAEQSSLESADRKAVGLAQQADGKIAALTQQVGETGGKVSALAAQQAKDNSAPILAVISSLRIALDRGRPFVTELGALKALGVPAEKLAGLQEVAAKGVQPSQQIAAQFRAMAGHFADPPVSHASEGVTQRLFSSAVSLVKVRRAAAIAGEDVVAVSSRVEAALAQGDADQAAAETAKLPAAAQEQAKPVIDAIKARQAALNTVARLEQDIFAAIAGQAAQR